MYSLVNTSLKKLNTKIETVPKAGLYNKINKEILAFLDSLGITKKSS